VTLQAFMRFSEEAQKPARPSWPNGSAQRPSAPRARQAGHPQVTDGPFAETKEALGGFYLLECASREEALEWAKKVPISEGGYVDVRPSGRCKRREYDVGVHEHVDEIFRVEYARVVASVLRLVRDIDMAEESCRTPSRRRSRAGPRRARPSALARGS